MTIQMLWQKYKYFPYERDLARREVRSLMRKEPRAGREGLAIDDADDWMDLAERATYFREVRGHEGERLVPQQAQLEAIANGAVNPWTPSDNSSHGRNRQSTRYSAHGLHEYRGKFNPQMVRAISNILCLQPGDWIIDPFCGSGTVLLEAFHQGLNAVGIDVNPLGVEIARAKISLMRIPCEELLDQTAVIKTRLGQRIAGIRTDKRFSAAQIKHLAGSDWEDGLNCPGYLKLWFTESVLAQLAAILAEIASLRSERIRSVMRIALSDILREVSLQDTSDLRIRRRKSPRENEPVVTMFLDSLSKKLSSVFKARQLIRQTDTVQEALCGSVLDCRDLLASGRAKCAVRSFAAAITSPPYATALPYIDTQRLSLVLLGLIDCQQIRDTERMLIGNREITPGERAQLRTALRTNYHGLPTECIATCQNLQNALDESKDGFRRQNVPALLYKYLVEMGQMFRQVNGILKEDAPYAMIVGQNRTRLGGEEFIIDTPSLLSVLAEANGFRLRDSVELNTYHRFHVHQANSIRTETLLILEKV